MATPKPASAQAELGIHAPTSMMRQLGRPSRGQEGSIMPGSGCRAPSRIRVGSSRGSLSPSWPMPASGPGRALWAHQVTLLQLGVEERLAALLCHHEAQIRLARPHQIRRLIPRVVLNRGEVRCRGRPAKRWNGWMMSRREMMSLAAMARRPLAQLAQGIEIGLAELQLVDGALGALQQPLPAWVRQRAALHQLDWVACSRFLRCRLTLGYVMCSSVAVWPGVLQPGQGDEGVQPVNVQHGVPLPGSVAGQRRQGTGTTKGRSVDNCTGIIWLPLSEL